MREEEWPSLSGWEAGMRRMLAVFLLALGPVGCLRPLKVVTESRIAVDGPVAARYSVIKICDRERFA